LATIDRRRWPLCEPGDRRDRAAAGRDHERDGHDRIDRIDHDGHDGHDGHDDHDDYDDYDHQATNYNDTSTTNWRPLCQSVGTVER
jgi:hypothetical protein